MDAISAWKKVDLVNLQKDLDVDAEEITKRREEAENRRKALVANTKEFRRTATEEVKNAVAPLIKQFQDEVDSLSRRSKQAETSFLTVYQRIISAPDPVPSLTSALEAEERAGRSQEQDLENKKLRETIEEYRAEFAQMKNQEVTIARLKEQLKELEANAEETVGNRVKEREKKLERQFAAKEREMHEERLLLATRLGESEQHAASLQAALDALHTETFEMRARYDEENAARQSTVDMLNNELERLQQRCESLEKEVELERERLAQFQASPMNSSISVEQQIDEISRANLEHELAAKDREIAQLIEDHRAMQQSQVSFKHMAEERISTLESALHTAETQLKECTERLAKQTDYEEIKGDLLVLKSIEFGIAPGSSDTRSLELLLVEKNKTLQSELTRLKSQLEQTSTFLRDLESKQSQVLSEKDQQAQLIARLEGELSNFQSLSLSNRGMAEGREGGTAPATVSNTNHEEILTGTQNKDASDTILTIVSSQRDRFRQRNLELEAESRHQAQTISSLRNEIDTVRSDNIKLYEKIKFLQGYQTSKSGGQVSVEVDETLGKYSTEYEEHINPFKQFNKQEKQRKYMSMTALDKVTFQIGRVVLGNKYARLAFIIYAGILHLLTFLVLYRLSHHEVNKVGMAEICHHQFANHMHDVHHEELNENIFSNGT